MDNVVAHAEEVIKRGSESFAAAARLFDRETREHAYMLYAWCRHCDDLIDGQVLGFRQSTPTREEQHQTLQQLRARTRAALAGEPTDDPVFLGLQRVNEACGLGKDHPLEMLDGFEMDATGRRYRDFDDLLDYCYHVAGVVGAMMARVMGVRDPGALTRAVDLGLAFQLTNICRDVQEDAANGRIYLPESWLEEAGVPLDPAAFPDHTAQLAEVSQRVLDEAERYYDSARYGICYLPWKCAWAVYSALLIYREIGVIVAARGQHAWHSRVGAGSMRKLLLVGKGGLAAAKLKLVPPAGPRPEDLWCHTATLGDPGPRLFFRGP